MEGSIRPPATPTTVRRNPPRRARPPPTPLASAKPKASSLSRSLDDVAEAAPPAAASSLSRSLDDVAETAPPAAASSLFRSLDDVAEAAPPAAAASSSRSQEEDRLKVFLRIRPLPDRERDRRKDVSRPMAAKDPRRKPKPAASGGVCLVATGPNSVALTVPQSKLLDSKRGRTEVFDGFSAVFSPDTSQIDVFAQVMNPLVDDFMGGKSGLLAAMGPTGSGKTHTIFGSPRNPGILPLTLRRIFNEGNQTKVARQPPRSVSLSIFEILSEGKGEHILDLLSDAAECVLQQSTIKGLQEVAITNVADAERLISLGMMKRTTAATNANSKSSRSQCLITLRVIHASTDADSGHLSSSAVLTIADLAGAERERRTGNQGLRLLESNFINNTSMVFGLCLRSLLEQQKNQKKPLEKHFKSSMLTRYLRDYLEGRKKMTLVLNVKPGDDYLDTSFLLRQASPYMKIKYTSLEDSSDFVSQKRSNVSLIYQEKNKKMKVHKPVVLVENVGTDDNVQVSKRDEARHKFLNSELQRISRSEEIMTKFAKALWTVLKQYKYKLLESENTAQSMKQQLRDKDIQIAELKRQLEVLNSSCSCKNIPNVRDTTGVQDDTLSSDEAAPTLVSQANQADLSGAATDNSHAGVQAVHKELDSFGNFAWETSSLSSTTPACSDSDDQSDQCSSGHHNITCRSTERVSQSPQFTSDNKKSTTRQSEDESEELSMTTMDDIHHDIITDTMHPDCVSSSHQVKSDTYDVSSIQSSFEVQGMKKTEEVKIKFERCEPSPAVEDSLLNHGCSKRPERTCPPKAPAIVKDSEAEDVADPLVLRPGHPKRKTSRKLQPVASMMLKEFGGVGMEDMDLKRDDRSNKSCSGRSDVLIELLKKGRGARA